MKNLRFALLVSAGLILSGTLVAAPMESDTLEAQKLECFRRHAGLMDKPSIRTVWKCWEVHGYLMTR